jgi:tetratricopeptide (TPR) repeat protein
MRAHVYTDRALAKHAGRFVWLSIDTEKASSARFLEAYPVEAWPTLFVIEPSTGEVALKWLGSATVSQVERLLDDGERSIRLAAAASTPAAPGADATLDQAVRLYAAKQLPEAEEHLRAAIETGGAAWPKRAQAVEQLVNITTEQGDLEGCANTALAEAAAMPRGPSFANVVGGGLSCALAAAGADWRPGAISGLEPLAKEAAGLASVLADDRSSLFETLVGCRAEAEDAEGAKKVAGQWLDFLEKEAAKASGPEARAAFDAHRVAAALQLGDPARTVPALLQSEHDLPADYNAPARLAQLYQALGRLDDALKANDRALAFVRGPRRLRLLEHRAEVLQAKGEPEAARKVIEEALAFAGALPEVQRPARQIDRLETQLRALGGSP